MYKPQYKSILTSKGTNLVSSGLPQGNLQKGSQSQTNIKSMSQQYTNTSIGQLKTNDQSGSSIIPPFESQHNQNQKQLSHNDTMNLFKKPSENNQQKSSIQKTPNSNSKLGQTSSPTEIQNISGNSKLMNQNVGSQSTTTITPFNKYSQNYLGKVKNISLGQQQQFSSTSQLKVSQNGFFKNAKHPSQVIQQNNQPKQESSQVVQAKQQSNASSTNPQQTNSQQQSQQSQQQNAKQTRHAKLDLFDISNDHQNQQTYSSKNQEETQDDQALTNQQQQKKDLSLKEYEKASSALQTLKSKMKRGESQNGDYETQQIQKSQIQDKNGPQEKNNLQQIQRGSELVCESKWIQAENEQQEEKPQNQSRIPLQDNKNYEQQERRGSNNNLNDRSKRDYSNNQRRQNSQINNYEDENDQNYKGNKGRLSLGDEENRNYINRPKTVMGNPSNQNYFYDSQYPNDFNQQNDQSWQQSQKVNQSQGLNPRNKSYYDNERGQVKNENNNMGRDQQWKGRELGNIISYDQFRQQNTNLPNNDNQFYYKQQQNYNDNNHYRDNYRQQQPYMHYDDRQNYYGKGGMQNQADFYEKDYRMNDYNDERNRNYPVRYDQYDNYPPQRMYDYNENNNKYRGQNYNYHNERDYYNYDHNMERSQTFYPPQNRYYNGPHYPPPPMPPQQFYGHSGYDRDYQQQRRVSEFNQEYPDNHNYTHYRRQTEYEGYRQEMQYDPSRYQVHDGIQKSQVIYEQNYKRDTSNPRQVNREARLDQNYVSDNYLRGQRSRSPINLGIPQSDSQRYQNQSRNGRLQDVSPYSRNEEVKYPPNKNFNGPLQDQREGPTQSKNNEQDRFKNQQINNFVKPEQSQNNNRYSDQPDYFKTVVPDQRNQRNYDDEHYGKADQKYGGDLYAKKGNLVKEDQKYENKPKPQNLMLEKDQKQYQQETLKSPNNKQKIPVFDERQQQNVNVRAFDELKGQNISNQNMYKSNNNLPNRNLDYDDKYYLAKGQQQKENLNENPMGVKNNKSLINFDDIPVGAKNGKNINRNIDEFPGAAKGAQGNFDDFPAGGKNIKNSYGEFPVKEQNRNNFDDIPVGGGNKNNFSEMPQNSKYNKNNYEDTQVGSKKNNFDDIPVGSKGNKNMYDDIPVGPKNNKNNFYDTPVGPKSSKNNYDDIPVGQRNNKNNFDETPVGTKSNQNHFDEFPVGNKKASNQNEQQSNRDIKKQGNNNLNERGNNRQNQQKQYDQQQANKRIQNNYRLNTYDEGNESNVDEGPINLNSKQLQSRDVKTLQSNQEYNDDRPIKSNQTQSYDLKNIPQSLMYGQSPPSSINRQANFNQNQKRNNQQNLKQQQAVQPLQEEQLYECSQGCGRRFNQESLQKHEKICKKVFQQKRKQFNSQAARLSEFQEEDYFPSANQSKQQKKNVNQNKKEKIDKNDSNNTKNNNKPSWKKQSEAFRMQLQSQRTGEAPDPQSKAIMQDALGYVPCNFCGRQFNKVAAERHIPFCEKKAKENQVKGVNNKQAANNQNQNAKQPTKQSQSRLPNNQNTLNNKRY